MPLYEVWHSYPLTEAQRADLAQRITTIHATVFTVPAAFVHVRFTNYAATEHYMGGKKRTGTMNLVLGNVRTGSSRPRDLYESLCRQLEAAWTASVGDPATQGGAHAHFSGAYVLGTVAASYKQGWMVPEAGQDVEWMHENLPKFQALADDGNEFCRDMIAELRTREDLKFVFENRKLGALSQQALNAIDAAALSDHGDHSHRIAVNDPDVRSRSLDQSLGIVWVDYDDKVDGHFKWAYSMDAILTPEERTVA
ncbi:hypothetical protein DFH09DRAFT_1372776 [Mycena vulgaris]|nr:hypothetical protein DFH09DRAFT_1372776 [Mycena vulgaris]